MDKSQEAPRLRLTSDIDFSKAKNSCKRCHGTGKRGYKSLDNPENPGDKISVPIICRCVSRSGGVKKDQFDTIVEQVAKQLDDGVFAEQLAADIKLMPRENRNKVIENITKQSTDPNKDLKIREALLRALEILEEAPDGTA